MVGVYEESKANAVDPYGHIPGEEAFGGSGNKRKTNESLWEGSKKDRPIFNDS
jgi:hypothetical protein